MTEKGWHRLSKGRQRRILDKMRGSTAGAFFFLTDLQLHRIVNGFYEGVSTVKKPKRRKNAQMV